MADKKTSQFTTMTAAQLSDSDYIPVVDVSEVDPSLKNKRILISELKVALGTTSGGTGNTTPSAPIVTADDSADTLSASHALGTSEIVVSENNGAYVAYSGQINVGNVARAQGYWKFKIKAATGRNESAVAESPAFTVASAPAANVPTTNLSAYWKMDEASGDFVDSHNSLHLVRQNSPATVAGKIGSAAELLHASNQYLTGPATNNLSAGASGFTVACWVYIVNGTGIDQQLVSKWGTQKEWVLGWNNDGISISISTDGGSNFIGVQINPLTAGGWHFVSGRWDGTNLHIWIDDGALKNSIACATFFNSGNAALYVGRSEAQGATYQSNARIDELGIWQRFLSDAELTDLYNSNAGKTY